MPKDPSNDSPPAAPVFTAREVICGAKAADGRELVDQLVRLVVSRHDVGGFDAVSAAVRARMESGSVVVAPGVAIPHARLEGLSGTFVAVATAPGGVVFGGEADPVRLAVLVLTPAEAPAAYLRVAAGVARRVSEPGFTDRVCAFDAPEKVAAAFGCGDDRPLAGDVTARDLMAPPAAVLHETNSVKDAIDAIVRTGLPEIPVVDKEGDLVGVASARALLRVCVPDYLLWMEDLSRFSNFEPFGTLLRKESSTWLADIMDDDYASVPADGPAIAVAEALARHGADTCYVVDGARLAGVVALPRFLHNVFRD